MAISTARLFSTGRVPGKPRHTGQTLVLGGSPKRVEQPQKIFVLVEELDVDFQADDGLVFRQDFGGDGRFLWSGFRHGGTKIITLAQTRQGRGARAGEEIGVPTSVATSEREGRV